MSDMQITRTLRKSRSGHWTLTLTDKKTGMRAQSEKYSTKHGALSEEDSLMESIGHYNAVIVSVKQTGASV